MRVKCEFCGNYIDDSLMNCPHCGAPNDKARRTGGGTPETIEELKQWYVDHNLPPENVTRFFIGKDIKERRAFGIYKDPVSGKCVVYKNKDDGSRAIRYEGTDEKYAVNELYQRLRSEISNQKSGNQRPSSGGNKNKKRKPLQAFLVFLVLVFIIGLSFYLAGITPDNGYYRYDDQIYYYHNDWYYYDTYNQDWYPAYNVPSDLESSYQDYEYTPYDYEDTFSDSEYFSDDDDWGSDWDNDSSWDSSDSWDSGSSDWGSDW